MGELVLAVAFLLVSHVGLSSAGLQAWLAAKQGAQVYRVAVSATLIYRVLTLLLKSILVCYVLCVAACVRCRVSY